MAFGLMVGAPAAGLFLALRPGMRIPAPWAGVAWSVSFGVMLAALRIPAAQSALEGTPDTPAAAFGVLFAA